MATDLNDFAKRYERKAANLLTVNTVSRASVLIMIALFAWTANSDGREPVDSAAREYRLGPDDQISIKVLELEKLQLDNSQAPKVDVNGDLSLPIVGRVHAEGLTLEQLEKEICLRLSDILQKPSVSVSIIQYRNHPVSVLGSVRNPSVLQVAQHKRLLEVLSMAGGLSPEAGDKIKISRRKAMGPLPLKAAGPEDNSADYYVGEIDVRALLQASDPKLNIEVLDNDVVTVPKAELVFVVGAVKRAGGFPLGDRAHMSILQALSLAEGMDRAASPGGARLLREDSPGKDRQQIRVNLKTILAGKSPDVPLRANDILFIPTSGTKVATARMVDAAVQLGAGAAIYR